MFNRVFPDRNPLNQCYTDNRRVFRAYPGRGLLNIVNHGINSAQILVNGKLAAVINDGVICRGNIRYGRSVRLEIASLCKRGYNTLKVLYIEREDESGYVEIWPDFPEIVSGQPVQSGFDNGKLTAIDKFVNNEIDAGFPGAVLCIVKNGTMVKNTAYGNACKYNGKSLMPPQQWQKMTTDTLFDLASNTKIYATVLSLMHLLHTGQISSVDDKADKYLPGFCGAGRGKITLRNLLEHSAGFKPEHKMYNPQAVPDGYYSQDRNRTIELLTKIAPDNRRVAAVQYSDTGFMILGLVIEAVTGMRLDYYAEQNIFKPLGLNRTLFNPLNKGFKKTDCAATERCGNTRDGTVTFPNIRKYTLQGEVHDEKAWYSMAGVAGHAGLFSTAAETAVLAQAILNGGGYGAVQLFDERILETFSCGHENGLRFGLGWNKMGAETIREFGPYAGAMTIGHSGWTGTVTVIDRENDLVVILLTNCIHSPFVQETQQFVHKSAPFETGRFGSIMALVYEAFLE